MPRGGRIADKERNLALISVRLGKRVIARSPQDYRVVRPIIAERIVVIVLSEHDVGNAAGRQGSRDGN